MTTVFLHHYYVPKVDYGHTYLTNFHEEFDNADHVGTDAILETNHRIGFWDDMYSKEPSNKQHLKFSLLYLDLFEKSYKYLMRKNHYRTRKNWQILE